MSLARAKLGWFDDWIRTSSKLQFLWGVSGLQWSVLQDYSITGLKGSAAGILVPDTIALLNTNWDSNSIRLSWTFLNWHKKKAKKQRFWSLFELLNPVSPLHLIDLDELQIFLYYYYYYSIKKKINKVFWLKVFSSIIGLLYCFFSTCLFYY